MTAPAPRRDGGFDGRSVKLLTQNVDPKILQEMLGHANTSETMDTYSHVLPNMQESAVSAMEEALK